MEEEEEKEKEEKEEEGSAKYNISSLNTVLPQRHPQPTHTQLRMSLSI